MTAAVFIANLCDGHSEAQVLDTFSLLTHTT